MAHYKIHTIEPPQETAVVIRARELAAQHNRVFFMVDEGELRGVPIPADEFRASYSGGKIRAVGYPPNYRFTGGRQ